MPLLAAELDEVVPDICLDGLSSFLSSTEESYLSSNASNEERAYASRNARAYPWKRRVLEHNGKCFHEFNSHGVFAPILPIINALPVERRSRGLILIYQQQQGEYDFNYHFDGDFPFGFRICFGLNTSEPFIEIGELKQEFCDAHKTFPKIESPMLTGLSRFVYPSRANTVFMLRGDRFPHRVPIVGARSRCVIIVRGEIQKDLDVDSMHFLQRIELNENS